MIRISERDDSDALHMAYTDGKKAIREKKKKPFISNPYTKDSEPYKQFEKGMKDQIEENAK